MVKHNNSIPKPILKWVGGKTQIIEKIISEFPLEINNYHEAFLGGGSVLIALLSFIKKGLITIRGNIYASDINEPLIYVYKNIQSNCDEVYNEIEKLITEFNRTSSNPEETKENYYYSIRNEYNQMSIEEKKTEKGSAFFIFLNKTCFRGIFRVSSKGFNVPYGHYNNPQIINKEHLEKISELIQPVIFQCRDFTISLNSTEPEDYLYLDPPYAPEKPSSFVGYTENGFTIDNHNHLFNIIHQLTEGERKIMISNADVPLVRNNFTDERYKILPILCKRTINSKNPEAKAKEVIIKNY